MKSLKGALFYIRSLTNPPQSLIKPSFGMTLTILSCIALFWREDNVEDSGSLADPNSAQKKILIVDDEPDVTFTIKVILTSNGYQVDAFEDAEEALTRFRKRAYFLAFLDIKMPKMNGFDLYKKLMEIDKDLKVCFLTALGEFDDYYKQYKKEDVAPIWGVRHIVRKPIDNSKLLEEVSIMATTAG
jgi:CheY-like chemotaxis protein